MNYLILHLIVSICTFFIGAKKNPLTERVGNVLIVFFFPIGGLLVVFLLAFLSDRKVSELEDDEFDNPIILFTDHINISEEVNILPIEELLTLEDITIKRKQVINTLKEDISGLLDKLQLALRDEDIETSHYAAAAISEIKRNMDLKLQEIQRLYEQRHEDPEIVNQYREVLHEFVDSNLYDEISVGRVISSYEEVLKNQLALNPESEVAIYDELIDLLFKEKKFDDAKDYIEKYMEVYDNEDSYIFMMELYYIMRDRIAFRKAYNVLLNSPVVLSNRGLEIVRFWMEGMKNETV